MLKRSLMFIPLWLALAATVSAQTPTTTPARKQTTQKQTTRTTTTTSTKTKPPATGQQTPTTQNNANTTRSRRTETTPAREIVVSDPAEREVRATFDALVRGIDKADVNAVMSIYWDSPKLILFNNNGTVTRSWEQVRTNRESSYPNLKDVRLDTRDVRVQMLGRDAALVTCLWSLSQESKGTPETASGRLTLVFRRVAGVWKIVHAHTSPDAPDPSRVLPSERVEPKPTATPVKPQR